MQKNGTIRELEQEWAKYKYLVLEKSHGDYQRIRQLLKDKSAYPKEEFDGLIHRALSQKVTKGGFLNGAQHVWGYFKGVAKPEEKQWFQECVRTLSDDPEEFLAIKATLFALARKYNQRYLLDSHYFDEVREEESQSSRR